MARPIILLTKPARPRHLFWSHCRNHVANTPLPLTKATRDCSPRRSWRHRNAVRRPLLHCAPFCPRSKKLTRPIKQWFTIWRTCATFTMTFFLEDFAPMHHTCFSGFPKVSFDLCCTELQIRLAFAPVSPRAPLSLTTLNPFHVHQSFPAYITYFSTWHPKP